MTYIKKPKMKVTKGKNPGFFNINLFDGNEWKTILVIDYHGKTANSWLESALGFRVNEVDKESNDNSGMQGLFKICTDTV